MDKISDLMLKDHENLEKDLKLLVKLPTLEDFTRFADEVERHFLTEENAILSFSESIEEIEEHSINRIKEDHQLIRREIRNVGDEVQKGSSFKLRSLNDLLRAHAKFESDLFYPSLDEKLTDLAKENIINKLKTLM